MKWISLFWISLSALTAAAPDALSQLRRQVEEQERQIRQLEVENSRLRYMLTEVEHHEGDPLYGIEVSGRPGAGVEVEPEWGDFHLVEAGDTLSEIAAARNVDLNALTSLNRLDDPSTIRPGQRLMIPERKTVPQPAPIEPEVIKSAAVEPAPPLEYQGHVVQSGENLYRISLRYGVALNDLLAANPSIDPRKLRVGRRVRVPRPGPMLAGGG